MVKRDFYLQSRGEGSDQDYNWIKVPEVTGDIEQLKEIPPLLEEYKIYDLIEGDSLVLAKYHQKLLLLITNFQTRERIDYCKREIRNSLACIGDLTDGNEIIFRGIAVKALREKNILGELIDKHVEFIDSNSFSSLSPRFKLTGQSLEKLKDENILLSKPAPKEILDLLKKLKNKLYRDEKQFVEALKETIGEEGTKTYKQLILKHADLFVGFKVNSKIMEELGKFRAKDSQAAQESSTFPDKSNDDNKKKIADELDKHRLPSYEGPLVVITHNKTSSVLRQHKVWRGLCNLEEQGPDDEKKKKKKSYKQES